VRNGKDPFLVVEHLTGKTFDLGLKSHDLFVLGLILIFIFILLGVQPVLYLCRTLGKRKEFYYDYFSQDRSEMHPNAVDSVDYDNRRNEEQPSAREEGELGMEEIELEDFSHRQHRPNGDYI